MDNTQIAATILERLTLMHGDTIPMGMAWDSMDDHSNPEGTKIEMAFDAIAAATQRCIELGELDEDDLGTGVWHPSEELDALIDTVAARIDLEDEDEGGEELASLHQAVRDHQHA